MNKDYRTVFAGLALAAMVAMSAIAAADQKDDKKKAKKEDDLVVAPYKGPKKRIAVMNMEVPGISDSGFREFAEIYKSESGVRTPTDIGRTLTEMLTTALDSTGRFILLERAAIGDIKDEMAITAELGNEKTAVKKGNVLGAQMLIRAAVTEFTPNKKSGGAGISLGPIRVGGGGNEAAVTLDLRFIDPNTSQVLYTAKAEGSSKSQAAAVGFNVGSLGFGGGASTNQPIERATRSAVAKAVKIVVDKMAPLPWEARVAQVNAEGGLIINRGANDGLVVGDLMKVYKPGATITDPETGEVLGRDEDVEIGEARVTWVNDRLCKATFTGSGTPEVNFVLKLFSN